MPRFSPWLLVVALIVFVGCTRSAETDDVAGEPAQQADAAPMPEEAAPPSPEAEGDQAPIIPDPMLDPAETQQATGEDLTLPLDTTRESLAGRWVLTFNQQGMDLPIALLEMTREDDEAYQTQWLATPPDMPEPQNKTAEVTDESAHLAFEIEETPFDFQGELREGMVRGNVMLGEVQVLPARLLATEADSLDNVQPSQDEARADFIEAANSDDVVGAMQRFADEHPQSPLALEAFDQIFAAAGREQLDADVIEELAADYIERSKRWGDRMERMAYIKVGFSLAATRHLPDVALSYLEQAEAMLPDDAADELQNFIEAGKAQARAEQERLEVAAEIEEARQLLAGDDEEQQQVGARMLHDLQQQAPFNPLVMFELAEHARKTGQIDEAIDQYSRLVALPMMENILMHELAQAGAEPSSPSETLDELWKEKHGDTERLDEHLTEVYKKSLPRVVGDQREPQETEGGNRLVLTELFTGAQCPPCVAADVATSGLEATYPDSQVVVLRYHQHIPGPDQLANEDSESRFFYYQGRGTPMIFVNGMNVENVGGLLPQAPGVYDRLRETIDPQLADRTDVEFELAAEGKDGAVSISAAVKGLDEVSDDLRLRLVLAEEQILFTAPNGIRSHEMLVRDMPGGPGGIAPEDGTLSHSATIQLSDLKQRLADYLAAYEEENEVDFDVKPLALDGLHLVAFVQNDQTREILQAAMIPVSGTVELPAEEEATSTSAVPKPETEAGPQLNLPGAGADEEANEG